MSGIFLLDWATQAVSLFNTILLLWLGLTVLLNAERRGAGLWIAGGQLLMGAAFFLIHSIILGHGQFIFTSGIDFWWRLGWIPVISLPYAWYGVMLWYAGYWAEPASRLRRRHRPWFALVTLLAAFIIGLLAVANPLPSLTQVARLKLTATPSIGGIPVLILLYPLYILLCISLSLDVLRRPEPSGRLMGDEARRRARPWLIIASFVELGVSILVGAVMLWVILNSRTGVFTHAMAAEIAWFDLVIASLIGLTVLLVGQAIVSYEVFTGKPLPRGGLRRYWKRLIILATGFSAVVSGSLALNLSPIANLLLSTVLMIVFYALLTWRSYAEREGFIERLRPFVAGQSLYDRITRSTSLTPTEVDVSPAFEALCGDVLGARCAYLHPLGPLALLGVEALAFPTREIPPPAPGIEKIMQGLSPANLCLPLEPTSFQGASWGIPLWSERGLIGALLLGEKQDGSLYTQEDFEIARAVGERLVDTQASAEMARRLMRLQRQSMAESQVLDRQTRRVLHDDVLPRLHALMLEMSQQSQTGQAIQALGELHRQISNLLRELPPPAAPELERLGLAGALRQMAAGEVGNTFEQVDCSLAPESEQRMASLPAFKAEVLYYAAREAVRNAARHAGTVGADIRLRLSIQANWREGLEVVIEDNGRGFQELPLREGGSGQGLALHSTLMAVIGGSLEVESTPGVSTRVILRLLET